MFILFFINDITKVFKYGIVFFADDLKLFSSVKYVRDASEIQRNLDTLASRCQHNFVFLNIGKCKYMSFYRKRSPVLFEYMIDGITISRVNMIRDMGVIFYENLSFANHIDYIVSKACAWLYNANMLRVYDH